MSSLTIPKVQKYGFQTCYSWTDELGFHQYYCEQTNQEVGEIKNFERKETKEYARYEWNDNTGYHVYYAHF